MKKAFALLLAAILAMLPSGCAEKPFRTLEEYQNKNPEISGILRAENGRIVDENGKEKVLFGINLGNWLLMETWMNVIPDYTGDWAHADTLQRLTERFGEKKTAELMRIYQDNYITAEDISQIERLGFNCVRVPFWYRNFMNEDGSWLTESMDENPGFIRLDALIEQCGEHGIYVILDLHGAPGGQSMDHSTGKAGRNLLYTQEECMLTAERLWVEIAKRYAACPTVAAYDLLNEPQNNGSHTGDNAWPAESEEAVRRTNEAYDRLYRAVRSVDTEHMISFEGIWSTSVLPELNENGYENILVQLHLYDTERGMLRYRVNELKSARKKWKCAVLVGEFNSFEEEEYACALYAKNDISYVKWTYKTMNTGSNWGIFNANVGRIDIDYASYEEIAEFFGEGLRTENCSFNSEEMRAITP